ncbi:MAG: hypothetical protein ABIC39_08655 [Pseudomonadota bacterium]
MKSQADPFETMLPAPMIAPVLARMPGMARVPQTIAGCIHVIPYLLQFFKVIFMLQLGYLQQSWNNQESKNLVISSIPFHRVAVAISASANIKALETLRYAEHICNYVVILDSWFYGKMNETATRQSNSAPLGHPLHPQF